MLWVMFAHVLMNAGYIASVVVVNAPSKSMLESATLAGATRWQLRWSMELPSLLPAVSSALLLVALYSATSFGLVKTLGQGLPTLETEISNAALRDLDLTAAMQLAALQTILSFAMFLTTQRLGVSRDITIGSEEQGHLTGSKFGSAIAWFYTTTLLAIFFAVLARAMAGRGLLENLGLLSSLGTRDLLNISPLQAAGNSLRNMIISLLIASIVVWFITAAKKTRLYPLLPIGISPVVWGLFVLIGIGYLPRVISSSFLVLPMVQSLFVIPLLYQLIHPARKLLAGEVIEAAKVDGANRWQLFRHIELPLTWPTWRIALSLAGLAAIGEFGAASFLAFGDQATLPVVIFRLISRPGLDNYSMAMTTAAILILLSAYIVWIANRESRTSHQVFPSAV